VIPGLSAIVTMLVGIYLLGLGLVALLDPTRVAGFFNGFARSAKVHYVELVFRFTAGAAFVLTASRLLFSDVFLVVGWILLMTTVALAVTPWRWHRRFAERGVPYAIQHLPLIAIGSMLMGAAVLASLIFGDR
jgi:hypothetical protein